MPRNGWARSRNEYSGAPDSGSVAGREHGLDPPCSIIVVWCAVVEDEKALPARQPPKAEEGRIMLVSLLLLASPLLVPSLHQNVWSDDPPVRVWFNSDGNYGFADRAKVYAKAAENGYLIVLRADAGGRVRVLFPLDPTDDQRITAGKKYELKGRGGREAFIADDTAGHGTVL